MSKKSSSGKTGGSPYSIIMVGEGAREEDGDVIIQKTVTDRLQGVPQLGGVGIYLAEQIKKRIDLEVRTTVLGHTQRGGSPLAFDRVLGTRLGSFAMEAAAGRFGNMVALKTPEIVLGPLSELAGKVRQVPETSQLIRTDDGDNPDILGILGQDTNRHI